MFVLDLLNILLLYLKMSLINLRIPIYDNYLL